MVNISFLKKPFFKAIFLSAIIITIPFLEFIKVNFFQIDYVIYSQIILYYLTVIILFFLLTLALSYILKDIFKIYNLVFTSAFSFWLIFKFDYLKSNFSFLREIYGRNFIIFEIIIAFVFIASHYMAINYVEEPAGFYPPYVEKRVVYPELYKKNK